jgi:hypothetical protein
VIVLDLERTGRLELNCLRHLLLLLRSEAAELRLEVALLDSRRAESRIQIRADLVGPLRDGTDVLDVSLVLGVLSARRTTAQTDDEQDDGENDEGDQPREAEHRDQALRRPDRASRPAGRRAPRGAHTLGRLFGLGLVEEVEFDV